VADPYVVFPYVDADIVVLVEPEILHAVDIPPLVWTTYGTVVLPSNLDSQGLVF